VKVILLCSLYYMYSKPDKDTISKTCKFKLQVQFNIASKIVRVDKTYNAFVNTTSLKLASHLTHFDPQEVHLKSCIFYCYRLVHCIRSNVLLIVNFLKHNLFK
jgi:hypothetical protein